MLDSFYHMTLKYFKIAFLVLKRQDFPSCTQRQWTSLRTVTRSANH